MSQGMDDQVVVIEDDPGIRTAIRLSLEGEGYQVLEAPDGAAGLHLLAASDKAVVALVDYHMPRLDGERVLRTIADDSPTLKRHAYVLVTANRTELSPAFLDLLAARHIPIVEKPFDLDELLATVTDARDRIA